MFVTTCSAIHRISLRIWIRRWEEINKKRVGETVPARVIGSHAVRRATACTDPVWKPLRHEVNRPGPSHRTNFLDPIIGDCTWQLPLTANKTTTKTTAMAHYWTTTNAVNIQFKSQLDTHVNCRMEQKHPNAI